MEAMAILLTLLLLAPDAPATKVPELVEILKDLDRAPEALKLLREIGGLKGNHAEAIALVKMIRDPKLNAKLLGKKPEVVEASFRALGGIGSRKVTKQLLAMLKHSRLKKHAVVRIGVCRALKGSADPKAAEALIKLMRNKNDHVIAAAAEAAGAYRYEKEHLRKELFKTILGIYESTWNLKNAVDPEKKTEKRRAEEKWEIIEQPMEKSLQLLSNVTQSDPPGWRRFWNKNKKKRWGDLEY
jgi:HEAT repeat protein